MRRREKIFWLAVGAAFVVGFIALIPAHGEICKESQKAGEEACTSYSLVPFLIVEIGKILDALGVAVTAVATIFIALFTLALRQSTDKLWESSERSLRQTQRAVIGLDRWLHDPMYREIDSNAYAVSVNQETAAPKKTRVIFGYLFSADWKNFGPTVAEHCEAGLRVVVVEGIEVESVPLPDDILNRASNITVGPQGGFGSTSNINIETLIGARDRKARIFLVGRFEYADVFGVSHYTQVCNELVVYGNPARMFDGPMDQRPKIFQFPIWPEHNSSS